MSGEHSRDDELDFLDEDFVLEEDVVEGAVPATPPVPAGDQPLAPAQAAASAAGDELPAEDLDELFAIPEAALASDAAAPGDADEVLFAVTAEADDAPATFGEAVEFDAAAASTWQSESFDLEEEAETAAVAPLSREAVDAVTEELERELAAIGSDEEDLVVDSDEDLELVDAPELAAAELRAAPAHAEGAADGFAADTDAEFAEAEFGDTFDAAPAQPQFAATEDAADDLPTLEPWDADDADAAAAHHDEQLETYVDGEVEAEPIDPDWAPLDEAALAESEPEVENPYAAEYYAQETELATSESSDLYVEDDSQAELAPVIGGPQPKRRWVPILASVAASVAIAASGALVVVRPEWFGLSLAPEMVPAAQVERPQLAPVVTAPALPALPPVEVAVPAVPTQPAAGETGATVPALPVEPPVTTLPTAGEGDIPSQPTLPTETPTETPTEVPTETPPAAGNDPAVPPRVEVAQPQLPTEPVEEPPLDPNSTLPGLPVPVVVKTTPQPRDEQKLVRVDDHLLVGGRIELPPQKPVLADGVTIGSRAFAQLDNGNYFIGSVKRIDEASLTLKLDHGEVSIPNETIVRLAKLGVGDYEALIKMTQGSVRLTNNNKLVGSIVSDIADDHVVLEFRSNRVVLPKSAIGGIVEGAGGSDVRLSTTQEEQDWLRKLVEREIGTGQGPSIVKTAPVQASAGGSGPVPGGSANPTSPGSPTPVPPSPIPVTPPSPIPPR